MLICYKKKITNVEKKFKKVILKLFFKTTFFSKWILKLFLKTILEDFFGKKISDEEVLNEILFTDITQKAFRLFSFFATDFHRRTRLFL